MKDFAQTYRTIIDQKPSNLKCWAFFILLWPWALLFGALVKLRVVLYRVGLKRSYRATVPVISIGNLTVGGTGKTPVVDAVVKKLLDSDLRVAVVSRGYGGSFQGDVGCVARGDGVVLLSAQEAGDEPYLLAQRNPALQVYVARKRALGVRAAELSGVQVIILDDGFQHLAVRRDVDIVLLDARAPFGNGQMLPAGPLREPPSSLRRASLVIFTHATQVRPEIPFEMPVAFCRHRLGDMLRSLNGAPVPWSILDGTEALAFAGIARPEDFFAALRARGVMLVETWAFDDHQDYCGEQLNQLVQSCQNVKFCITTEKDAVKLNSVMFLCQCLVAPLELEFDNRVKLDRILDEVVGTVTKNP
ncbi:tetraacyldisaccharide 4'-kinase [Malonomonas rubra]|uniref:tetraacyldisaccharide 4'-kinase n=1 Tax=Malonomonas rubra TaxID=57040 RepID=UPI0026EA2216|nr:tetraacyldisaccharide 4'-kinase [Malonomonas rubra]